MDDIEKVMLLTTEFLEKDKIIKITKNNIDERYKKLLIDDEHKKAENFEKVLLSTTELI